uniref:Uncharacterized protein n=1 Tax=Caenorhabditis japonica TaxID=281687 RepID=A0A8R1IYI1_CAEJA
TYKPPSEVQKISSTPPEDDPWNSESVKNSKTISIDDEIQEDDVEFVKDGEKKKKKRSWKVFDESDDDIIIMKNNSAMEDDESMNDSNAEIPG